MSVSIFSSAQLYTCIAITPNSGDDWTSTSPFAGYDLSGGITGFVLSNIVANGLNNYNLVTDKLISISNINKSVDVFQGGPKNSRGDDTATGIGGVAKVSDLTFTLEGGSDTITISGLLGRNITVYIGTGTTINDPGDGDTDILFIGKIYGITPSRFSTTFTVRGRFNIWNKDVGTLTDFDSQVYKSKIYPISYGDFTDDHAYIPIVLDAEVEEFPSLYLDEKKLVDIANLYCWDPEAKIAYTASDGNDIVLSSDNNSIKLETVTNVWLKTLATSTQTYLDLFNPSKVAFEFDAATITAIAGTPLTSVTFGVSGSVYRDGADTTKQYEYIEEEDGYYKFTLLASDNLPSAISGTLNKVSGTGPSSLTFDWHSGLIYPDIQKEEIDTSSEFSNSYDLAIDAKPRPAIISSSSEQMQIIKEEVVDLSYLYDYTRTTISRGYNNTTKLVHGAGTIYNYYDSKLKSVKWLVKNTFKFDSLSGLNWVEGWVSTLKTWPIEVSHLERYGNSAWSLNYRNVFLKVTPDSAGEGIYVMELNPPRIGITGEIFKSYFTGFLQIKNALYPEAGSGTSVCIGVGSQVFPIVDNIAVHRSSSFDANGIAGVGYLNNPTLDITQEWSFSNEEWKTLVFSNWDNGGSQDRGFDTFSNIGFKYYNMANPSGTTTNTVNLNSYALNNRVDTVSDIYLADAKLEDVDNLNRKRLFLAWYIDQNSTPAGTGYASLILADLALYIHFYVDPLKNPWWGRGKAREYDPDGFTYFDGSTSGLIENPVSVIEDILRREIGLTDNELSEVAFDAAYDTRLNWKTAGTHYGSPLKLEKLLTKVCQQFGLIVTETHGGEMAITSLTPPESDAGLSEIADSDILLDSKKVSRWSEAYTTIDKLITNVHGRYQLRHPDGSYIGLKNASDMGSVASQLTAAELVLDDTRDVTIDLDWIRDDATAEYMVDLFCLYFTKPLRMITVDLTLGHYGLKVGDWVTIDSSIIPNVANNFYLITKYDLTLPIKNNEPVLKLTVIEMESDVLENVIQEVGAGLGTGDDWQEVDTGVTDDYQESV